MRKNTSPSELLNKQVAQASYDSATLKLVANLSEVHEVLVIAESHGIDVINANRALIDIMDNITTLVENEKKLAG